MVCCCLALRGTTLRPVDRPGEDRNPWTAAYDLTNSVAAPGPRTGRGSQRVLRIGA